MTPDSLIQALQQFLFAAQDAVIIEDGAVIFDLAESKYSISGEHNKCLLQIWSAERNVVRRILDAELKNDVLRLQVQKLGQSRPSKLEICRQRDRRTPSAKRSARLAYQRSLQRAILRGFPGFKTVSLSTSIDLERSFGPIYSRGLMRQGQSAFAILGVNSQETQSSIDAALTFGILWLDACRKTQSGKLVVEGLHLFAPRRKSTLLRERIGHLNRDAAKWTLFELDERDDTWSEIDLCDRGNVATRLVHSADQDATRLRFATEIAIVQQIMSEVEVAVLSPAEIAFRCHGLEFARARLAQDTRNLRVGTELVFGLGAEEHVLSEKNTSEFRDLVCSVGEVRHPDGPHDHPLWRMHPERWLESLVVKNVSAVDDQLDNTCVYSQVPAFSASDRAMIDVLAVTRQGRLIVLELKADEDIHLPLQGLDYWARVAWHQERGEFQRFGYFPCRELSTDKPLLVLVAPALRIHPATDTLLHYLSPEIEWMLIAIDERWRSDIRAVFRKRRQGIGHTAEHSLNYGT